jgi:hypothetical protein
LAESGNEVPPSGRRAGKSPALIEGPTKDLRSTQRQQLSRTTADAVAMTAAAQEVPARTRGLLSKRSPSIANVTSQ